MQPPPPISGCIEQLQLSNQAGPVPGARIWSGKHSRYTRDYADGSLAIDCAAIACMVRSGEPFFIGRPSLGAETRAAHLAAVMRMRARPNVVSRLIRDLASPPGVIIANGSRQQQQRSLAEYSTAYANAMRAASLSISWGHSEARRGTRHLQRSTGVTTLRELHRALGDDMLRRLVRPGVLEPWWTRMPLWSSNTKLATHSLDRYITHTYTFGLPCRNSRRSRAPQLVDGGAGQPLSVGRAPVQDLN